jgi:hypothetical protein
MKFAINKKFLIALPLAWASLEIFLGVILGYFFGKLCAGQYDGYQRVKSVFLNIGNYRLHIHHWIIFLIVLVFGVFYNLFPFLPQFFSGVCGGLIIQDLYLDSDWWRILIRRLKN